MLLLGAASGVWAAEPLVVAVSVEGNSQVVASHILSAVDTKVGEPLDRERLKNDVEAIYALGEKMGKNVKLQLLTWSEA